MDAIMILPRLAIKQNCLKHPKLLKLLWFHLIHRIPHSIEHRGTGTLCSFKRTGLQSPCAPQGVRRCVQTSFLLKNDNYDKWQLSFPPHPLGRKLCSKFIIIYNIYIIYNNGIIRIFSSSVSRPEYDTVICHNCHICHLPRWQPFQNRPFCYLRDYKIALCRLTLHSLLSCWCLFILLLMPVYSVRRHRLQM